MNQWDTHITRRMTCSWSSLSIASSYSFCSNAVSPVLLYQWRCMHIKRNKLPSVISVKSTDHCFVTFQDCIISKPTMRADTAIQNGPSVCSRRIRSSEDTYDYQHVLLLQGSSTPPKLWPWRFDKPHLRTLLYINHFPYLLQEHSYMLGCWCLRRM